MTYTLDELKQLVLPMLLSMEKGHEDAVATAIIELIKQDREARDGKAG